ncbi:MacB family efflux pump subunit [Phreatobacter sp. HK31-P]
MGEPLIRLSGLSRDFQSGDQTITVLRDINLDIRAGEMVAIMGASGSGKSTLMNILGCLDRPSRGSYAIDGQETASLSPDDLADLRRNHFGFIFQRYNLLDELSALGNVEIPAVYAGMARADRQTRAAALLGRLGLADRSGHRPSQLSGGQQQRVSIARSLMNDPQVILADEPTGALDTAASAEVLRILEELNAEGHTVVIVTHDPKVAARARRIIEISDGRIVADEQKAPGTQAVPQAERGTQRRNALSVQIDGLREAFAMAWVSMNAHRLRSFLTMLGIIIGIASVVCMVALGQGSRQRVLANISGLGTNTLEIFPGTSFGDVRSGKIKTLVVDDARALEGEPYASAVTPTVSTSSTVRYRAIEASVMVNGVGDRYFAVKGTKLREGRFFDADSVRRLTQDVVIDENTAQRLFPGETGIVGQIILIGSVPCRIVGVAARQQSGFGSSQNLSVFLPYTTVQSRFLGDPSLRSITVRVREDVASDVALRAVTRLLLQRHGRQDFFILNTDDIRQTMTQTTETLTLLIASIAVISLVVGGIGVMNIMLVSVVERTREIGVRLAVGGRRRDILQQFLIEAVLITVIGGIVGVITALGLGSAFNLLSSRFALIYSPASIVLAFVFSMLIGLIFGFLPARNAARLDPVVALAR